MSSASDIANLFEVADASPSQYREVERAEQSQGLRGRWSTLNAAEPDPVAPAPVASAQGDAADPADILVTADTLDAPATTDVSPDPVSATPAAAASEPPPAEQAAAEAPVAQPLPEPVVAVQQSAALSSVFARLMERNEPRGDVAQRGAP
ncbi:BcsR/BcsP family cellulose biosynthesis protein [Paraburkholderia sp. EG287B]|uniref:BcsR/BcsP family cellulose biosynthesis protein n=1 Tax=unclassified Paraburkholderia TaxID=2615204 RepID=UPI0034D22284